MGSYVNGGSARYGYVSGLDGLRLIAVGIVILAHYRILPNVPGGFGVSIFFFISGFLITRLMLAEEKASGTIALGPFYIRRLLRLLPPLALMGVVAVPLLWWVDPANFSASQIILSFLYLGNIHKIGARLIGWDAGYDAFEPLWSLSVEEHFYLLLPPVLLLVRERPARVVLVLGVILAALLLRMAVWRVMPAQADTVNYNFTLTRLDALGLGVLLTLLLDMGRLRTAWIERYAWLLVVGGGVAALASMVHWSIYYETVIKYTPQSIAIGAGFCGLVFPQRTAWLRALLEAGPVRYLGRISYEIYLWHLPVLTLVGSFVAAGWPRKALALALCLGISALAYEATTRRLAQVRRNFGGHPV
jgi:peptidoglycan/LPS O-acetylase OafA/YrhL